MKQVTIAGVPEHFNLPWHLAIEDGAFDDRGIDLNFIDVPEGTGKMCSMLRNNETDLAIILTEGIIKDIAEGNPSKIVQGYVDSPLIWGIHTAANAPYTTVKDLKGTKAAISRFGSGSHLMAYVNAHNLNWNTKTDLNFEVVNTLDGAIKALTEDTAQYFMWEKFTTKPVVDKGIFKRVGECPTPWPCFVIVATDKFIEENESVLEHILDVINVYTDDFKHIPSIDRTIANRYGIQLEDVQQWIQLTRWTASQLKISTVQKVIDELKGLALISDTTKAADFLK